MLHWCLVRCPLLKLSLDDEFGQGGLDELLNIENAVNIIPYKI